MPFEERGKLTSVRLRDKGQTEMGFAPAVMPEAPGMSRAILGATARLLRQRGYEATTLRGIAEQVGIKAASIYHHYPSKDAVVAAVVNEGVRFVHDAVVTALAACKGSGPRDRVQTAVRAHLLASLEHSDYTSASIRAFAFLPPGVRAQCTAARRDYEAIWRDLIAAAAAARLIAPGVSPDAVRLLLLGAVNWAGEWYKPGQLGIDALAHDFTHALFHPRHGDPE